MKRRIIITGDGSQSILVEGLGENFHSSFGAYTESKHIYINGGFRAVEGKAKINVLEVGMGTGLNILLTLDESLISNRQVYYFAVEAFPVGKELYDFLDYTSFLNNAVTGHYFQDIHSVSPGTTHRLTETFELYKIYKPLELVDLPKMRFNVVYYDAFGPDAQPEMWTPQLLRNVSESMVTGGIFVTFTVKGTVKRVLRELGFMVETLPGPPGKRHFLKAIKKT